MKKFIQSLLPLADMVLVLFVYPAAYLLKGIRTAGMHRMPLCRGALMNIGVFPIRNHYTEPLFDSRALGPLEKARTLPGIDWNLDDQLSLLKRFIFGDELNDVTADMVDELSYYLNNGSFGSGDAEFLYNIIRLKKPARVFEIGSGNSTLIAMKAIRKNCEETPGYQCKHLCVEPYERPWLEKTGVTVVRQLVEEIDMEIFLELEEGDLLFIDSSHIIRPQGDVVFEYLELLPTLKKGVIVHVHDIFSPRDYLKEWVVDEVKFWNEQYLFEAFLTSNKDWMVIGAVNYLHHNYHKLLKQACPFLTQDREPGSFYIQKTA